MKRIAVLASGSGTNFEAIVKAKKKGVFQADIRILVTDKKHAFVRRRAQHLKIKDIFIDPAKFKTRLQFDKIIIDKLLEEKIDIVVLAGYMRILSSYFVKKFKNKIVNIHPALLPSFKGANSIQRAFGYGCKITGVTVHFVDESVDNGPIISQESISIAPKTSLKTLEEKIHRLEHKLYPQAIKLLTEDKLRICGRCVNIR